MKNLKQPAHFKLLFTPCARKGGRIEEGIFHHNITSEMTAAIPKKKQTDRHATHLLFLF